MSKTEASPAVNLGTQNEKRITLTRGELEGIIIRASGKVKTVSDLKRFVDVLWGVLVAKRDGAVMFDREGPEGRRFT